MRGPPGNFATVGEALRWAGDTLACAEIEATHFQATVLLAHALGVDRAAILARVGEPLRGVARRRFCSLVERRRQHEPLQYLTGRADFLDFEVAVRPGVFIPRPETELVVERALEAWSGRHRFAIDLCTGSGIIAIALARARPDAQVIAIDISPIALETAWFNADQLGVADRIQFIQGDLLEPLEPTAGERIEIGVLVCNPPYVAQGSVTQPEVLNHEPTLAWIAGTTGLEIYQQLIPQAAALLVPGCSLVLELGYDQDRTVPDILCADCRWGAVSLKEDLAGIPRVLVSQRKTGGQQGRLLAPEVV